MSHRSTLTRVAAFGLFATGLVSGAAQAALIDRGGGLIYDDVLNVTWLQDANYAKTSGYDTDGWMTWNEAVTWADNLTYYDSVRNITYDDWRLPTTTDLGTPGCDSAAALGGTDCGYNVDPTSSEMAHLYFVSLGNLSFWTTTGANSGAYTGGADPFSTLDIVGPFLNFQAESYWSGTEYAPYPSTFAWGFVTGSGAQYPFLATDGFYAYALAVRPGDVAAVPEAETYAMLLAGLGMVAWRVRRRG